MKEGVKDNVTNQKTQQGLVNALTIAHYCNTSLVPLLHYNFQLIYYNCNHILTLHSLKPLQWISIFSCMQAISS